MGSLQVVTSNELDIFLLEKKADYIKKGIKFRGNGHLVIGILEELMNDWNNQKKKDISKR